MRRPIVDIGDCTLCMGCVEVCPQVFQLNENAGYVQVAEMDEYPEDLVDEAIKYCPEDCIYWEES